MNFTITLSEQELGIVGAGLGKLPFENVAAVIHKLNQQISEQAKPVEVPNPTPKKEKK